MMKTKEQTWVSSVGNDKLLKNHENVGTVASSQWAMGIKCNGVELFTQAALNRAGIPLYTSSSTNLKLDARVTISLMQYFD